MIVSLDKITGAMQKVKSFAQDIKTVPGVLLKLGDGTIEVCYSDGKKSIVEKIEAVMQEGEQLGDIIVPYQMFMDIINVCQPTSVIECDDLTITVKENNILSIETTKYSIVGREVDGEIEAERKPVSSFKQEIKYSRPDEDIRYGILSRMDYDSIFESDKSDVWEKSVLQDTLSRVNKEDGKVCYFSGKLKAAFVVNVGHTIYIPKDEVEECGFSVSSKVAKYLVEILGKTDADKVQVSTEDVRYCKITTPDETVGIWFEMASGLNMDAASLKAYESKQYEQYQFVFNRYALQDVVKRAITSDTTDTTSLTFSVDGDNLVVSIVHGGTSSKSKSFYVLAESFTDNTGKLLDTKIPVSLKALNDIIDNCAGDYLLVDVADNEKEKCLRCMDVVGKDQFDKPIAGALYYTISAKGQ